MNTNHLTALIWGIAAIFMIVVWRAIVNEFVSISLKKRFSKGGQKANISIDQFEMLVGQQIQLIKELDTLKRAIKSKEKYKSTKEQNIEVAHRVYYKSQKTNPMFELQELTTLHAYGNQ
jgi:hypothetical protein